MAQHYSDPAREEETYALPGIETLYRTVAENAADGWLDDDGDPLPEGWYWWSCFPGCLPDSDPIGPFDSETAALDDARGEG